VAQAPQFAFSVLRRRGGFHLPKTIGAIRFQVVAAIVVALITP